MGEKRRRSGNESNVSGSGVPKQTQPSASQPQQTVNPPPTQTSAPAPESTPKTPIPETSGIPPTPICPNLYTSPTPPSPLKDLPSSSIPKSSKGKAPMVSEEARPRTQQDLIADLEVQHRIEQLKEMEERKHQLDPSVTHPFKTIYAETESRVPLVYPDWTVNLNLDDRTRSSFNECKAVHTQISHHRIRRVIAVQHKLYKNIIPMTTYKVRRADQSVQLINDQDLMELNPPDLLSLAEFAKSKREEIPDLNMSYRRLLDCMKAMIDFRSKVDYQIAMEHQVEVLSVKEPNISLPDNLKHQIGEVLTTPEEGVVFKSTKGKAFFRADEAIRYPDSLLDTIYHFCRIAVDKANYFPRISADKIIRKINSVRASRNLTRQFHYLITEDPRAPF